MQKKYLLILFSIFFLSWEPSQTIAQNFKFPMGFGKENYDTKRVIIKYKSSQKNLTSLSTLKPDQVLDEKSIQTLGIKSIQALFSKEHSIFKAEKNKKNIGEKTKRLSLIQIIEFNEEKDIELIINTLRKNPAIEYAEPIYTNYQSLLIPNDPLAQPNATQYHLNIIKAYQAWDIERGNSNMIVGVIDNSFDLNNTDLRTNNVAPAGLNRDVANNDNNVFGSGSNHGTLVALCASAIPNNGVGGAGTAYNCRFLPMKVARDNTPASPNNINVYVVGYEAIILASQVSGCKVLNLSWGRRGLPSFIEEDVLATVVTDYDVLLVAAAGNDNNTDKYYPASYDQYVLSVAATDATDAKALFSPSGGSNYNSSVDISAPGRAIVTALGTIDGTSFASPLVAGAAALVRNKYPSLNAYQTMARLKTTADYIDNLSANQNFRGGLGSGRLNMLRAVSDPFKAITLTGYGFENNNRGYLFGGYVTKMFLNFKNHLDALNNLQVTLSTDSPYINILDNQAQIGSVAGNSSSNNFDSPFEILVANNIPTNTIVVFKLTYTDDSYSNSEELRVVINPGIIDVNFARFTVGDWGNLAVFDNSYPALAGLSYDIIPMLKEAGLMLGVSVDSVSSAVRVSPGIPEQNFKVKNPLTPVNSSGTYLETTTVFEDITNNSKPIGLEITQKTYAWNEPGLQKSVVVAYDIKNQTVKNISNLFAGIYANWDIITPNENIADWDAENQLGYVYDPDLNGLYGGIVLLTDIPDKTKPTNKYGAYTAFDNASITSNDTVIRISDNFSESEKYRVLAGVSTTRKAGGVNGTDVSNAYSAKVANLPAGKSQTVAFAFVVGESLNDIQQSAIRIRDKFKNLKQASPPPAIDTAVCAGTRILIKPKNGSTFNFYLSNPLQSSQTPIHTGGQLIVDNVINNQTLYVTNIDSLYESQPAVISIRLSPMDAQFNLSNTEFDFVNVLNLVDNSANVTTRQWKIQHLVNPQNTDFSFVENTTSNAATAKVKFNRLGDYQITLKTINTQGCADSLTREISVFQNITTGLSAYLQANWKVFPNPNQGEINMQLPSINQGFDLILMNSSGKEISRKSYLENDFTTQKLLFNDLNSGLYFLKLQTAKGYAVKKIIIEK